MLLGAELHPWEKEGTHMVQTLRGQDTSNVCRRAASRRPERAKSLCDMAQSCDYQVYQPQEPMVSQPKGTRGAT